MMACTEPIAPAQHPDKIVSLETNKTINHYVASDTHQDLAHAQEYCRDITPAGA